MSSVWAPYSNPEPFTCPVPASGSFCGDCPQRGTPSPIRDFPEKLRDLQGLPRKALAKEDAVIRNGVLTANSVEFFG